MLTYSEHNVYVNPNTAMDSSTCHKSSSEPGDWRDGLSISLLYDFIAKNVSIPTDFGQLVAYLILLVVSWYVLVFSVRFVVSLVKPVLIVVIGLFLFEYLRHLDYGDTLNQLFEIVGHIFSLAAAAFGKCLKIILDIL
ncbi:hypothetical protein KR074_006158 [Drosophila pseudoananassae]|nr:hypothetical protein KR074_006158 [Drosophila pseudoananassae]